ncbi:hypothetical protein [Streptomyces sp. NBC_01190]|uniref:hypothetical protein n=1 Tax=Streptomyces sp. NBC_01190 TaxID=2903767 RepID=UPI0038634C8D|nr:hypothetical protein OG519_33500 [Streptomyces sp. NBC_01190]
MASPETPLILYACLTAVLSAGFSWLTLARRYAGKGRLFGSRYAACLTVATVACMTTVAVTTNVVLCQTQSLPAVAAGVVAGIGVAPRTRHHTESVRPLAKVMSLGIAFVIERLDDRMRLDRARWCEDLLAGFTDFHQMRSFVHEVTESYIEPRFDAKVYEDARERLAAAVTALTEAAETHERIEAACRRSRPADDPRPRTPTEQSEYRRVHTVALTRCKQVLALVYDHGRRSEDAILRRLRQEAAPDTAFRHPAMPQQRESRALLRRRR